MGDAALAAGRGRPASMTYAPVSPGHGAMLYRIVSVVAGSSSICAVFSPRPRASVDSVAAAAISMSDGVSAADRPGWQRLIAEQRVFLSGISIHGRYMGRTQ